MKSVFNSLIGIIIVFVVFSFIQSFYWEYKASNTEAKSYVLVEILQSDMKANFRRIDMGLPVRQDTVLMRGLDDMRSKMKTQRNNAILYKLFGWKIG